MATSRKHPHTAQAARLLAALGVALAFCAPNAAALTGTGTRTPARPSSSGAISTPALVLAVLAGLLALACIAWALARSQAIEPRWAQSLRHSLAEGGFRASATWAEFADWARLGR